MPIEKSQSTNSRLSRGRRASQSLLRASEIVSTDGPVLPAEIRAWYAYDWSFSPYWQVAHLIMTWFLKRLAEYGEKDGSYPPDWLKMSAGSYPSFILGVTSFVQVFILLTFSAFGDYGGYRKSLMMSLTYMCCLFLGCSILCTSGSMWWLAGLLRILMGCCFVLTNVYYNSYLPLLTSQHPEVLALQGASAETREVALSNEISSKGQAFGYAGGVSTQIMAFFVLKTYECKDGPLCSEYDDLRWFGLLISLCGLWWAVFSLYTFKNLKVRAGGPFPQGTNMLCLGWKDAGNTLCTIAKLKNTFLYTFAYFIWSDALTTLLNITALIVDEVPAGAALANNTANTTLTTMANNSAAAAPVAEKLDSSKMILLIGATLLALIGVMAFMGLQQAMNLSTKTVIMVQLCVYAVMCAFCALGGISSHYMVCMAVLMLMLGSLQANQRSLFSNLAPVGKEAGMFAFYTITDKGSSLIGATVTTLVHTKTHSYLGVFWYCFIAYASSAVILYFVDVQEGMRAAGKGGEGAEDQSQWEVYSPHNDQTARDFSGTISMQSAGSQCHTELGTVTYW